MTSTLLTASQGVLNYMGKHPFLLQATKAASNILRAEGLRGCGTGLQQNSEDGVKGEEPGLLPYYTERVMLAAFATCCANGGPVGTAGMHFALVALSVDLAARASDLTYCCAARAKDGRSK